MTDYKEKYLKYKKKYLELKKNQIGGLTCPIERAQGTAFFDIDIISSMAASGITKIISGNTKTINFAPIRNLPSFSVELPTVHSINNDQNFLNFIISNLLGLSECSNNFDNLWGPYLLEEKGKIYILDLNNVYFQMNTYYWENINTTTPRARNGNWKSYIESNNGYLNLFTDWYKDNMRHFFYKKLIIANEMIIIINKNLGPQHSTLEDILNDPDDTFGIPVKNRLGINLIAINTFYSYKTNPWTSIAYSGSADDYVFWIIIIGIYNIFKVYTDEKYYTLTSFDNSKGYRKTTAARLTGIYKENKLKKLVRKFVIMTNDKQKHFHGTRPAPAAGIKSLFSDLYTRASASTPLVVANCQYLSYDKSSQILLWRYNLITYNLLNILTNIFIYNILPLDINPTILPLPQTEGNIVITTEHRLINYYDIYNTINQSIPNFIDMEDFEYPSRKLSPPFAFILLIYQIQRKYFRDINYDNNMNMSNEELYDIISDTVITR